MSTKQAAHLSIRLYRWLAQAFPEPFLRAHGDEVMYLTEDLIAEVDKTNSFAGLLPFVARMFLDLLRQIFIEYWYELAFDLRFAVRNLMRQKAFAVVAILSLSLGISMCTSMWGQLEMSVFKRTPAIDRPDELVALMRPVSFPVHERMRDSSGQFAQTAAYLAPVPFVNKENGKSERWWGHIVTSNYFTTLGVKAHMGRLLGPEDKPGIAPNAVITHRLWTNHFGSARDIVGKRLEINGYPVTVVGVSGEGFLGASPMFMSADFFLPVTAPGSIAPELGKNALEDSKHAVFTVLGRLVAGRDKKQAEAALDTLVRNFERENGDPGKDQAGRRVTLVPGGKLMPIREEDLPTMMGLPLIMVGLMLWIACANVATMLLAKALARRKEIATRIALGASRARIIRQLLTESTLIAVIGGGLGVVWAIWMTRLTEIYKPMLPTHVNLEMTVSWAAIAFTAVVSIFTGILFGLTPALQATNADVATALKSGSLGGIRGFRWFSTRNALVLQQVAASLTLLLLTGFIIVGFNRQSRVDMGFQTRDLWQYAIDPMRDGYSKERSLEFFAQLRDRLATQPGIRQTSLAVRGPMSLGQNAQMMATSQDLDQIEKQVQRVRTDRVGVGFFETLEVPLKAGRLFRDSDVKEGALVAVVNETLVKQRFPGRDPLGQYLEVEGKPHRVIGVIQDLRSGFVISMATQNAYLPIRDEDLLTPTSEGMTLMVRAQPGFDVTAAVRSAVAARDPELTVFNPTTITEQVNNNFFVVKVITWMYGGIGIYGLLLAAIGLAGVTAHAVVRRTKEIGIRVALGAPQQSVLRLVLREGFWLTLIGSTVGIGAALAVATLLRTYMNAVAQMTETTLTDPVLVIGAPLLLIVLALAACYVPARRASRISPIQALREE